MSAVPFSVPVVASVGKAGRLADLWQLLKPRVMTLVVYTGAAGVVAAPGHLHPFLGALAVLAIALGAGGAGALNQVIERDLDARMRRTAGRPLPQGRVSVEDGWAVGLGATLAGIGLLFLATNWVAAALLALAVFIYVVGYTLWLKPRTPQNIVWGGISGALPPAIGWAAVAGEVSPAAWSLVLIVALWTPPHSWALAIPKAEDYRAAGIPMLPTVKGAAVTRRHMIAYAAALVPASLLPWYLGAAGTGYAVAAGASSLVFFAANILWRADRSPRDGYRLFGLSMLYLLVIFTALMLDATHAASVPA